MGSYKTWTDLSPKLIALYKEIEDAEGEDKDGVFIEQLLSLHGERDETIHDFQDLVFESASSVENLKFEMERLIKRIDSKIKTAKFFQSIIDNIVKQNGGKLKTSRYSYSVKRTKSVDDSNIGLIPEKYKRYEVSERLTLEKFEKLCEENPFIKGKTIVLKSEIQKDAKTDVSLECLLIERQTVLIK